MVKNKEQLFHQGLKWWPSFECCIVGSWTCFSFLKTFHLSTNRLLQFWLAGGELQAFKLCVGVSSVGVRGETSSRNWKKVQLSAIRHLVLPWPGWLKTFISTSTRVERTYLPTCYQRTPVVGTRRLVVLADSRSSHTPTRVASCVHLAIVSEGSQDWHFKKNAGCTRLLLKPSISPASSHLVCLSLSQ